MLPGATAASERRWAESGQLPGAIRLSSGRFRRCPVEVDASYTDAQRQEYADAEADADTQIALAELVYKMRTEAGISQTELARRMGARQPFISDLE